MAAFDSKKRIKIKLYFGTIQLTFNFYFYFIDFSLLFGFDAFRKTNYCKYNLSSGFISVQKREDNRRFSRNSFLYSRTIFFSNNGHFLALFKYLRNG